MKATIFDIQRGSTVDGPGFRTTVFFKGCNLRCAWCHNPESQAFSKEILFYKERCTHCGTCVRVCPNGLMKCTLSGECAMHCPMEARVMCGREYTVEEVLKRVMLDKLFYVASGGGATFSGGECLLQVSFLVEILRECKENGVHTAVDTAGDVPFEAFVKVIPYTDMFLYDVKIMSEELHKNYTGNGNHRIQNNLSKLLRSGKRVWVRVPIIPGVNDTQEEMRLLREFLLTHGYPEKVELLPYHRMGENKQAAMNREIREFDVPTKESVQELARMVAR